MMSPSLITVNSFQKSTIAKKYPEGSKVEVKFGFDAFVSSDILLRKDIYFVDSMPMIPLFKTVLTLFEKALCKSVLKGLKE